MTSRSLDWACFALSSLVLLGLAGCPPPGGSKGSPSDGGACPVGSIAFPGTVLDGCQTLAFDENVPLDGVQVSTLQPFSSSLTSNGGQYVACLPAGQPTTLQYTMPGFVTTYLAEFSLTAPPPGGNEVVFMMFCDSFVTQYTPFLPGLDTSLATVFGLVNPGLGSGVSGCDGGFGGGQLDGWTFTASLVGGGVSGARPWIPAYVDTSGDVESVDATFDTGQALVYNVDPSVQYVALHGVNPALGVELSQANEAFGLTGRVYVAAGDFSYDPWIVPGLGAFQCPESLSTGSCPATGLCTLASGQSTPLAIALDATSVYWTDQGSGKVMKAPLGGGSATALGASSLPYGIAVDSNNVYWADYGGTINKAPLRGGGSTTLATGQPGPYGIAVDSHNVYWTNYLGGTIMKVPIGGGNSIVIASGQPSPNSLAVDSENAYWTSSGTYLNNYSDGMVMKAPLDGGSATTLASGQAGPLGIALDATTGVYWADYGPNPLLGGTIMKVPRDGGAAIALASGQGGPSTVAVDAANVYWTSFNGMIMAMPLGGGEAITLASGQNTPDAIAVGPTGVYWTNWGDGTVVTIKPGATTTSGTTSGGGTTGGTSSGGGTTGSSSSSGSTSGGGGTTSGGVAEAHVLAASGAIPAGGTQFVWNASYPFLVHDTQGNQLAGWYESPPDAGCIDPLEVAFYDAATATWSDPTFPPIPSGECPGGYTLYQAALSATGDALVVWGQYLSTGLAFEADHYDTKTGVWDGPTQIVPPDLSAGVAYSAVALGPSGEGWIVYEPMTPCSTYGLGAVSYSPDAGFGVPVLIKPNQCAICPGQTSFFTIDSFGVAALADDSFVAAWGENETTGCGQQATYSGTLAGARATAAGWGVPFYSIAMPDHAFEQVPYLLQMAGGGTSAVAAWTGASATQEMYDFYLTGLKSSDSTWEAGQLLVTEYSALISVAINGSGSGVATWLEPADAGSNYYSADQSAELFSSSFVLGGPQDLTAACALTTPLTLAGYEAGVSGTAAINADGGAAVVWVQADPRTGAGFILGATYDPATGWGPCAYVDGDAGIDGKSDYPILPMVADLGGGNWGTFWIDYPDIGVEEQVGKSLFQFDAP